MWPSGPSSSCWPHPTHTHTPLATRFSCNPTPTTSSSSWSYYRIIVTMASALGQSKPHTIQHAQGGAQMIVLLWLAQWNNTCPQLTGTRKTIMIRHHLSDTWVASQSSRDERKLFPMYLFDFVPASLADAQPSSGRSIYRSAYMEIRLRQTKEEESSSSSSKQQPLLRGTFSLSRRSLS